MLNIGRLEQIIGLKCLALLGLLPVSRHPPLDAITDSIIWLEEETEGNLSGWVAMLVKMGEVDYAMRIDFHLSNIQEEWELTEIRASIENYPQEGMKRTLLFTFSQEEMAVPMLA